MSEIIEAQALMKVEAPSEIEALIRIALDKGINPTELYAILREERTARAVQAFNAAFARFKATCPPIRRRSENAQFMVTRNGVRRPSRYAALEDIDADTRESLTTNGLSCAWGDAVVSEGSITMTCFVFHIGGHKQGASCTMPYESKAGSSPQQKYAATITYLQRYSLIAALGLTTCDDDPDCNEPENVKTITEEQAGLLDTLIQQTKSDPARFLRFAGAEKLSEIKAFRYDGLVQALKMKLEKQP